MSPTSPQSQSNTQYVLVLNCGSSSFKFALLDSNDGSENLSGLAERLGSDKATITIKRNGSKNSFDLGNNNEHLDAINALVQRLKEWELANSVVAIGHRVVHGGEKFTSSVLIDDATIESIEQVSSLAPLHNPANIVGINAAQIAFPGVPQVAVFDTAFHQTMPQKAYLYAIDKSLYREHGIRRYGFHGTSHYYVANQAALLLEKNISDTSVITVHLGNGCSICAVENGQSVDTSMGLTPMEGLVMGTRSGDIDPGALIYLMRKYGYDADQLDTLLNKKSGLIGLSELSNDCRTLEEALDSDDKTEKQSAKLALDVFAYRVAKYIASYTCALSHLDAVVFTGGIGENSNYLRSQTIQHLAILGLNIDENKNKAARFGEQGAIHSNTSSSQILVIPTNEELVIAQDSLKIINEAQPHNANKEG